jgi:hypothetical protein
MLDITAACRQLVCVAEVHVVAVNNECKELLFILADVGAHAPLVRCVNLAGGSMQEFSFLMNDACEASFAAEVGCYLYEPNAAIIKAGAFKLIAQRYELCKMSINTHLYLSDKLVEDFPGRVWQIVATDIKKHKDIRANIMTRNYPLTPEQLRKKLKIKDSDTHTIIGARLGEKPCLFLAKRIDQHTASC